MRQLNALLYKGCLLGREVRPDRQAIRDYDFFKRILSKTPNCSKLHYSSSIFIIQSSKAVPRASIIHTYIYSGINKFIGNIAFSLHSVKQFTWHNNTPFNV